MAKEYDIPVQSHLCEQLDEISTTMALFPGYKNSTSIFDKASLLTNKVRESG